MIDTDNVHLTETATTKNLSDFLMKTLEPGRLKKELSNVKLLRCSHKMDNANHTQHIISRRNHQCIMKRSVITHYEMRRGIVMLVMPQCGTDL